MENRQWSRIEMILESEVELTRARFREVNGRAEDQAKRAEARVRYVQALDRFSNFILRATIPEELAA